jgi:hypothetical protein
MLFYVEGDREACEAVVTLGLQTEDYDIMPGSEEGFFVYGHATLREQFKPLVETFRRERVVTILPIEFRSDRTIRLTVIGESAELQASSSGSTVLSLCIDCSVSDCGHGGCRPAAVR